MNILIVDDRPPNLKLLRYILESEGHAVCEATDGIEALAILNRDPVDVIISDILMPRMDGYRLCQEVRKSERHRGIPFIFYTATYTSPGDEKLCLELGGDKYMQKPATPEALAAAVQEVTQNGRKRALHETRSMDENEVMKEYSARLVFKLEEKIAELLLQTTAMENAANAIVITDAKGRMIRVNPAFTVLSGYAPEEALGQTPRILKSGRHDEAIYRDLWRTILVGQTWRGELINRRKDGSVYYGEQTITPVRAQGGPITHFIGIMNDVTERKRAEEALRESERMLRLVMDLVPHHIFAKDAQGRHLFANRACAAAHGLAPQQMVGLSYRELGTPQPEAEASLREDQEVIASGQPKLILEERVTDGAGQTRYFQTTKMPFIEPGTGEAAVLSVSEDITERKALEQQFLRAQRMESIGTLAGGIAHDLNNVLGPIVMSLDLLAMKFPSLASTEFLDVLRASAQRGVDMVGQILSFARGVEGRRMELQVAHLVRDIEKIANETFLKQIQMRTNLPRDLWTVTGDPTQLHQVLLNLCVNARDAMPNGGTLTVSGENLQLDAQYVGSNPEAQPGPYVVLQIEDNGTGIPPEVVEKIFDPFFTTKELGKGTGLGLSTSLAIVKNHGGFIHVHSVLEKGTRFRVYLPAQTETCADVAAESAPEMPLGHGELILVVDDEVSVRLITQQTLEAFGYRVVLAADGVEAVALYATRGAEIAAVLTDMMMPVMDGPTTIQVLRNINPHVRIIAATGLVANHEAASIGVKHFLPKPFTSETLLKALKELLSST